MNRTIDARSQTRCRNDFSTVNVPSVVNNFRVWKRRQVFNHSVSARGGLAREQTGFPEQESTGAYRHHVIHFVRFTFDPPDERVVLHLRSIAAAGD